MRKILFILLLIPLFTEALTPVFTCGAECGVSGTTGGQHWQFGAAASFNTTIKRNGNRAIRLNGSAVTTNWATSGSTFTAGNITVIRGYFYATTLPTTSANLISAYQGEAGAWFNSADSKIYAGYIGANFGATGITVTTATWYLIDIKVNASTNPWTIDVSVDGVSCGQKTRAVAAASGGFLLGSDQGETTTMDVYFDDILVSQTAADYPIGAGHTLGFVPASDGSHTSTTTHTVKGTAAAPTAGGSITSATTDAFNWVNGRPIGGGATDATRLINAQTAASTEYIEVGIEQTTETTAPRAVEFLVVDQQATTAVGDMHIKVNDNGTETVVLDRTASAGVITDRYTTKQFATMPTGGAAWTLVRFKALKIRFGYSSDATPDQYWRGAMVEAEFTDETATVPGTPSDKRLASTGVGFKP